MSDESFSVAPARLVQAHDELGRSLLEHQTTRQKQPSYSHFLRMLSVHERTVRRRTRRLYLGVAAGVGGLIFAQSWAGYGQRLIDDYSLAAERSFITEPGFKAERPLPSIAAESTAASPPRSGSSERKATDVSAHLTVSDTTPAHSVVIDASPRPKLSSPITNATAVSARPQNAQEQTSLDCGELHKRGQTTEALDCYEKQARGSGLGAELSYLERARLQQFALNDLQAALSSLTEYQSRFPHGTLLPEATLSRISLLARLGQGDEARRAIKSAALTLPEKALSLRELAVDLAVSEGNCSEAQELVAQIPTEQATELWKQTRLGNCSQP